MEEEGKKGSNVGIKLIGLVLAFLAIPFKFFISNPKAFLVFLVIAASVGGTVYIARTNPKLLGIQTQSVDQTREETEILVKEVGQIIALPEGEIPQLATVTNVEEAIDNPFFSNAQNGDKVLIYSVAGKAYLYRPSEKKIIEVGVVNLNQTQANEEVMQEETQLNDEDNENKNEYENEDELLVSPTTTPAQTP